MRTPHRYRLNQTFPLLLENLEILSMHILTNKVGGYDDIQAVRRRTWTCTGIFIPLISLADEDANQ